MNWKIIGISYIKNHEIFSDKKLIYVEDKEKLFSFLKKIGLPDSSGYFGYTLYDKEGNPYITISTIEEYELITNKLLIFERV